MIVVEGPDGSGKSTLVAALKATFGLELQSRVVGADTVAMVNLVEWVEHHNSLRSWHRGEPTRLYDRHRLISEFIYGPILHRPPEPGFSDWSWVLRKLAQFYLRRPLIIYCLPPIDVVRRNVSRPDTNNSVVTDHTDSLWVAYARQSASDAIAHGALIYDYTNISEKTFLQYVGRELDDRYTL